MIYLCIIRRNGVSYYLIDIFLLCPTACYFSIGIWKCIDDSHLILSKCPLIKHFCIVILLISYLIEECSLYSNISYNSMHNYTSLIMSFIISIFDMILTWILWIDWKNTIFNLLILMLYIFLLLESLSLIFIHDLLPYI